jgi:hypothetical protein
MNKDDAILFHLNRCNLQTVRHLKQLTRNNSWLNESLRRMVAQKKIYRKFRGKFTGYVYASYDITRRNNFDHDLPLADIYTPLALTGRLLDWEQPKDKWENELNEDATFHFAAGSGSIKYYLEYETGKNNWRLIDSKFARYLRQRTEERFNVLFVLRDESLKSIKQMTRRAEPFLDREKPSSWKLFLFTTADKLVADPLGKICHIAYDSATYPLAPDLVNSEGGNT